MTQMTSEGRSPVHSPHEPHLFKVTSIQTSGLKPKHVDMLILGAGWLSQFLIPLLANQNISHAATTTTGRDDTIPFKFDPSAPSSLEQYRSLPSAATVLVTFPLPATSSLGSDKVDREDGSNIVTRKSAADILLTAYEKTHPDAPTPHWILLGSTGEWKAPGWHDRHSPAQDSPSPRWQSESAFLERGGCVLHLAGLYGAKARDSKIWELAVPKTKEGVQLKAGVHFIHGMDVSRAVVAVHLKAAVSSSSTSSSSSEQQVTTATTVATAAAAAAAAPAAPEDSPEPGSRNAECAKWWERHGKGQRWILTDTRTYDWWTLIWDNAHHLDRRFGDDDNNDDEEDDEEGRNHSYYRRWVLECMREDDVRGLPRDALGRRMDSREFWETCGIVPVETGFGWPR